jgi:hypothetical protein
MIGVLRPTIVCWARSTMLAGLRRCWIRRMAPSATPARRLASLTPMIGGESSRIRS